MDLIDNFYEFHLSFQMRRYGLENGNREFVI
jgi:hypothetical protein